MQGVLLAKPVHQGLVGGVAYLVLLQHLFHVAGQQRLVAGEAFRGGSGGDNLDGLVGDSPGASESGVGRELVLRAHLPGGGDDDDEDLRWIGDNPDYYRGLDLTMVEQKAEFTRNQDGLWVLPKVFQ